MIYMAHIYGISTKGNGWIEISDDKHSHKVPICPEGVLNLIWYLKNSANGKKEFYEKALKRLKDGSDGKYLLKLAIDNSERSDSIIKTIYELTNRKLTHHTTDVKQ